ncbi:hypothetical protein [Crateriforma conspicua]|uniref:hypothetical protein n=1 Tax=Crateriforma conspicua TaxID=2527996 RepID=UPI00118A7A89|nr:hypothetical protein [Crateriforma conspicua]QDV62644.1 hypothetical protein Mal65_17780 [Crateriforma conspicua]
MKPQVEPDTTPVTRPFTVTRRCAGRQNVTPGTPPPSPPPGRLPRVTKLLALAIHFDELIRTGAVTSQAELARLGQVSRPRLTQIMNLLHLSPDIQEEILHHCKIITGRDPITERELRVVALLPSWEKQRTQFSRLTTHL